MGDAYPTRPTNTVKNTVATTARFGGGPDGRSREAGEWLLRPGWTHSETLRSYDSAMLRAPAVAVAPAVGRPAVERATLHSYEYFGLQLHYNCNITSRCPCFVLYGTTAQTKGASTRAWRRCCAGGGQAGGGAHWRVRADEAPVLLPSRHEPARRGGGRGRWGSCGRW